MFRILNRLKLKHPGQEIKVVDIVSHGGRGEIKFPKSYTRSSAHGNDFSSCAKDAAIILDACSTGRGTKSIADKIARSNPGKTVFAPGRTLYTSKPVFKKKAKQIKVEHVVHGFAIGNAFTCKKFFHAA